MREERSWTNPMMKSVWVGNLSTASSWKLGSQHQIPELQGSKAAPCERHQDKADSQSERGMETSEHMSLEKRRHRKHHNTGIWNATPTRFLFKRETLWAFMKLLGAAFELYIPDQSPNSIHILIYYTALHYQQSV